MTKLTLTLTEKEADDLWDLLECSLGYRPTTADVYERLDKQTQRLGAVDRARARGHATGGYGQSGFDGWFCPPGTWNWDQHKFMSTGPESGCGWVTGDVGLSHDDAWDDHLAYINKKQETRNKEIS